MKLPQLTPSKLSKLLLTPLLISAFWGSLLNPQAGMAREAFAPSEASLAQSCNFTDWVAGRQYYTGNIVRYNGSFYVAEHDNPGYDPTISTWFWEPTSCGGGGGGGGSCSYTDWVAGRQYYTGNIVRYNGSFYVAEHDNPGYDPTISTWFWEPTTCGGTNPPPVSGFGAIVSKAQFEQMFPNRNSFYSYEGLVQAAAFYPAFAGTGSTEVRKREAAAALANFAHETGNFVHITEIAQGEYCQNSAQWPCAPGKRYFGRGPIQLSWNYNYGLAGQALGLNLLNDPDLVSRDSAVAWKTALWYWMTQRGPGSMTPHEAMVNGNGFGETIRSINGSVECNGGNPGQVQSRVSSYQSITNRLGVSPGNNLYC
ncbi:glycoside hydrolase family 19 protein [Herpetosiphon giganteus]|uniref:glycoside hydrolase family 19 protein n=1 Tax=Herpetosiphon giganteus TaxID=2029754 RepID=UPI00195777F1|nr:glycoside hydrolase family 19 protein [Herpetosiphon giganteus]MBM7845445.1 putative chitinase [Herpetosiphon giganteus]